MSDAVKELERMAKRFAKAAREYAGDNGNHYYFGCAQTYQSAAEWCRERARELSKPARAKVSK